MPEFSGYAAGTPCWVDLGTPDVDASVSFYGELFGWEADDLGEEAGGYRLFRLNGKQVAGVGPLQDEQQPPAGTTDVSSDDAAASRRRGRRTCRPTTPTRPRRRSATRTARSSSRRST